MYLTAMQYFFFLVFFNWSTALVLYAQVPSPTAQQRNEMETLIANYSKAREARDTVLLKRILTEDVDQLVSTGEWRQGLKEAVQGMLRSSAETPGTRVLTVERIRLLNANNAVVDCRYTIQNTDATLRKMWSTFVVVLEKGIWKIAAIRNMLPTQPQG